MTPTLNTLTPFEWIAAGLIGMALGVIVIGLINLWCSWVVNRAEKKREKKSNQIKATQWKLL